MISTVNAKELEKHVLKCNARPLPTPSHFSLNLHQRATTCLVREMKALSELFNTSEWIDIVKKIENGFDTVCQMYKAHHLQRLSLCEALETSHKQKHSIQQNAILNQLKEMCLLDKENTVFIEWGAGKGELSFVISSFLSQQRSMNSSNKSKNTTENKDDNENSSSFLLIDRKTFKHKHDPKLKFPTTRLKIDIKDLNLRPLLKDKMCVCYSKHLCGAATDLTLSCLSHYMREQQERQPILGICIALCCHHLMTFDTFVSPKYLENLGITRELFYYMCRLSSWATCGQRSEEMSSTQHVSGLNFKEREELGWKCKRIFDMGRVFYLRDLGFTVELETFVDRKVSLENMLLKAFLAC